MLQMLKLVSAVERRAVWHARLGRVFRSPQSNHQRGLVRVLSGVSSGMISRNYEVIQSKKRLHQDGHGSHG